MNGEIAEVVDIAMTKGFFHAQVRILSLDVLPYWQQ